MLSGSLLCKIHEKRKARAALVQFRSGHGTYCYMIYVWEKNHSFLRMYQKDRRYREQLQACQVAKSCQSGTCDGCFHRVESTGLWMQLFTWVRQVLNFPMCEIKSKISKREMTEFSDCLNLISSSATFQIVGHSTPCVGDQHTLCFCFLTYRVVD